MHKYTAAGGEALSEVQKRHHLMNITPEKLYQLWQVQPGFMQWDSTTIKERMLEMIQSNSVFGVEDHVRHGLYDLGSQPCGGTDGYTGHDWNNWSNGNNCGGNCGHNHDQPDEDGHLSVLMGMTLTISTCR